MRHDRGVAQPLTDAPRRSPTCHRPHFSQRRCPTACASSSRQIISRRSSRSTSGTSSAPATSSPVEPGSRTSSSISCSRAAGTSRRRSTSRSSRGGGSEQRDDLFDRTNDFETLPSHQLELALWLEADRMATLLDALDQENLDNQREVVKNEKRQSYDNRPYGSFYEKLMASSSRRSHPYHHTPIGSMEDLNAAHSKTSSASSAPGTHPTTRSFDRRRRRRGRGARGRGALLRADPGQPEHRPAAAAQSRPHRPGVREIVPDNVPLTRVALRLPLPGLRLAGVRRPRGRQPDPRRRPWLAAVPAAGP